MKMNKIIIISAVVFMFSGCENFLTIEPTNEVLTTEAINSAEDIQKTLIKSYLLPASQN